MTWFESLRLKSPNPRMRCKAVENLSGSERPSDTQRLFASLEDENAQVRCAAVRALARANAPDGLRRLVGALEDGSFEVREAAVRALGGMGDLCSAPALAGCLKDPDLAVRMAAAGALRSLGWKPSTREELAWFEIALGHTPAEVSASNAPAAVDADAHQETSFHRRLAAEAQKERTDPARIKSLLAAVRDSNLLARIAAVHDLGQMSDPQVTWELLKLFRHPDPETRLAAAKALAGRGDSQPAHFLGLLQDTSPEVRLVGVQFLGRVRHEQVREVLYPLLSDPSEPVRQATAAAIEQIANACDAPGLLADCDPLDLGS